MPELPDVENMRRKLLPARGAVIRDITVYEHGFVDFESPQDLIRATIKEIARRGKFILISLNTEHVIVAHMGMTGELILEPSDNLPSRFTKCTFKLLDGRHIDYNCTRKFGILGSSHKDNLERFPLLHELGPEPLESKFTEEIFLQIIERARGRIKPFLMDQRRIAGMGNLCVDEILFQARIDPRTPIPKLNNAKRKHLYKTMRRILNKMVENYDNENRMRSLLINHRREGASCPRCHAKIRRILVDGRGTYLCSRCQQ